MGACVLKIVERSNAVARFPLIGLHKSSAEPFADATVVHASMSASESACIPARRLRLEVEHLRVRLL